MSLTASFARIKFNRTLVGVWSEEHRLIGLRMTFHKDGTGSLVEWGFDHLQLNPEYVTVPDFHWKGSVDRVVEITYGGVSKIVSYDFMDVTNEYGVRELRIFEVGRKPDERGDIGFWLSPFSLVYRGRVPSTNVRSRLWKKIVG